MLELPEVLTVTEQMRESVVGKKIMQVLPPSKLHKFCWYNGEPESYDAAVRGSEILSIEGFGIYVEVGFDNGYKLCFNDGVNARLMPVNEIPKNYQLLIELNDGSALVFTVAMYGGIILHDGTYDNEYYIKSRNAVSPFSAEFEGYYRKILTDSKSNLSAKAFLAAEQRFPGIGNGVSQDILFAAGIHPKRKVSSFRVPEKEKLFSCMRSVLHDMVKGGGRDTEKDIYNQKGGYPVRMSKNSLLSGCPECGSQIIKETYLGGSIYYCPVCQPFDRE